MTETTESTTLDFSREFNGYALTDQELEQLAQRGYVWVDHENKGERTVTMLGRVAGSDNIHALAYNEPHLHDERLRAEELSLRSVVALEKIAEQLQVSNVLAQALVEQAAV